MLMVMGKTTKPKLVSKPLLILLLFLVLIIPCLYYVCYFLGLFGLFSITSFFVSLPIMILSTIFLLQFTKKKPHIENTIENEVKEVKLQTNEEQAKNELKPILECFDDENEIAHQSQHVIEESEVLELEDFPSESEDSSEQSDDYDDFELKWNVSSTNVGHNLPFYDTYFSDGDDDDDDDDDDNLIEINLPGSDLSGFEEDMNDQSILEDMNEFNFEEDNLIEIDISIGSIKCPRFDFDIKT